MSRRNSALLSEVALVCVLLIGPSAGVAADLRDARHLLLTGRYEEAVEAFCQCEAEAPIQAALGRARALESTGAGEEAATVLRDAVRSFPDSAELPAELARLAFGRGDYDGARALAGQALDTDENQLTARWISAELCRVGGQLDQAEDGYEWFVDYYNGQDDFTPDGLRWIGRAAAQYARWNRNSGQFRFLLNELFPAALELDEDYWPAHLEMALLLAEKYNETEARAQLSAALVINPNAAEVHAARAELALRQFQIPAAERHIGRALEINPNLPAAHRAQADVYLAQLRTDRAIEKLETARELNPLDEGTLGRLAAAYGVADGFEDVSPASRCGRLIDETTARNPHCGPFFTALADSLDRMRKYPNAARYYREAETRMPRLLYARGQLGLVLMRLGDEQQATRLLESAFRIDPFNVRVKNMLEVLDVLKGYTTVETDHFVIRFDATRDAVLARYASRYLEEIYPKLITSLGYEPPHKSLFEIFSSAKNTSGHGWFSARMVGLPFIGTVGACAGQMVAITSPNDTATPFSWARVLKHEFVHVVTLQQTKFNIPHWYTEALAVRHEGEPRPAIWNSVLARRAREDDLLNLETINLAFIRPRDQDEWALAYCQAELYAEFMVEQYGAESLRELLQAYRDNLKTPAAIRRCFGVEVTEFERRYRDFLDQIIDSLEEQQPRPNLGLDELKQAAREAAESADRWADLADYYLRSGDNSSARKCSIVARRLSENHPLASYVLAKLQLLAGDETGTVEILQQSLDEQAPLEDALALLASLAEKNGEYDEAERLCRLGTERFPLSNGWLKSLSRIYLKSDEPRKLKDALAKLARMDGDDLVIRKKLLQLCVDAGDLDGAVRWGTEAYQIDVMDAEVHALLGNVYSSQKRYRLAVREYATAVELLPEQTEWEFAWAENCLHAGDADRAVDIIQGLLTRHPEHQAAKTLLERIRERP